MALSAPVLLGTPPALKTSGTTLTQNSVTLGEGDTLIVAIAYDNAQGAPTSVKWGNRNLEEYQGIRQANIGTGMTIGMWRLKHVFYPGTRDVVATWSSAILERTFQCIKVTGASALEASTSSQSDADTTPATGVAQDLTVNETLHIAAFAAQGPTNDTAATARLGHTLLGRSGTSGAPPVSNVTLQTSYEVVNTRIVTAGSFVINDNYKISSIGTTDFTLIGASSNTIGTIFTATGVGSGTGTADELARGGLTVTTARDFANNIIALKSRQTFTIKACEQRHNNRNHLPDSVWTKIEDESGRGFWFELDPDIFDAMTDTEYYDYCKKICSIWTSNIINSELVWDEDSARDTRMSGFVNDTVSL